MTALDAGVSTRHLSYVETGKARPSPELVMCLAECLDVPLHERNELLLAAGFAPSYSHRSLDDPAMAPFRASVQRILDAHDPFPGVAVDRAWDVVVANRAAGLLTALVAPEVRQPPINVFRICLHPDGLAPHTVDFASWARHLLRQLHRSATRTGDPRLAALEDEVRAYPTVAAVTSVAGDEGDTDVLVVPFTVEFVGERLSMFTTLTTFGGPRDVTLDDLAVELFYPSDAATAATLRRLAEGELAPG